MKIIVCIDDGGGMLFHNRRQSKDRLLRKDILENLQGSRLWVNSYSAGQFEEEEKENLREDEAFLEKAGEKDTCFVENLPLGPYEKNITELTIYKWNRKYPSDKKLDIDMSQWELADTTEFAGSSHDRITKEIYRRKR